MKTREWEENEVLQPAEMRKSRLCFAELSSKTDVEIVDHYTI